MEKTAEEYFRTRYSIAYAEMSPYSMERVFAAMEEYAAKQNKELKEEMDALRRESKRFYEALNKSITDNYKLVNAADEMALCLEDYCRRIVDKTSHSYSLYKEALSNYQSLNK